MEEYKKDWLNDRNKELENTEFKVTTQRKNNLMIFSIFLLVLIVLSQAGYLLYLINDGKLKDNVDVSNVCNPQYNITSENNNKYDFNPEIKNTFENQFDIELKIDEKLLEELCNGQS